MQDISPAGVAVAKKIGQKYSNICHISWPKSVAVTMVLEASFLLVRAAPVFLGVGPSLLPVGESSVAVIDSAMRMAHPMHDVGVKMVAAMPGARAPQVLVIAAPGLLVCRPSKEPIGVA